MAIIFEHSFTQRIEVIGAYPVENNVFDAYRIEFVLSPSCYVACTVDFGTDGKLRVENIKGRQTPESLAIFAQFISNEEWLKSEIKRWNMYQYNLTSRE